MKIVDIDVKEIDTVSSRGRARSPEMKELISVVSSLKSGDAKAIVASEDMPVKKVRSRLLYAARISDKRLRIGEQGDRVIFALDSRPRTRRRKRS